MQVETLSEKLNGATSFGKVLLGLAVCWVSSTATALEFNVEAGTTNYYTEEIGSDVPTIEKKGGGRLHLQQGMRLNAFQGTIDVEDGTLGADTPNNFGMPRAVTVSSGATLDLSALPGNADAGFVKNSVLVISGYGYDNAGAFRRVSGESGDDILSGFILANDTMFYNGVRCSTGGTIDFGGYALEKQGDGEFLFNGITCANMGNLVLNGGQLTIQGPGCTFAGDASNALVTKSGTLCLWSSPGAGKAPPWTLAVSNSIWMTTGSTDKGLNGWDGPVVIPADRVLTVNTWGNGSEITFSGLIDNKGALEKRSTVGTLWLTGACTTNNYIAIEGGAVRFKGDGSGRHELGQATTANEYGEISFDQAGRVHQYSGNFWIAGNGNNLNTVVIKDTVLDGWYSDSDCTKIALGFGEGFNGRLIIDEGSVLSNRFSIGAYGRGAVHQRGGDVYWQMKDSYGEDQFGSNGYAFYGLDAGSVHRDRAWMGTGIWSPNACSFFVQRGGTFEGGGDNLIMGARGYAELYVGGGTHVQDSHITMGPDSDYPDAGGAIITVANGASLSVGGNGIYAEHLYGFQAVINLNNGGMLTCGRINTRGKGNASGSEMFINANGGVLRPSHAWGFTDEWNASANDPTRATIYDGGLVVDASECVADGDVARIPFAFQRPYGLGIKSIELPAADSDFWKANFLGPTRIRISGTGKAATAIMDFDLATSRPVGVIVTSPGYGYDANTTVMIDSWDGQVHYPCRVEMFEHTAKGGFTLRGAMGLTLAGANTWGGPTTVESGILSFEGDSYPANSPLVIRPAGIVDFYSVPRVIPSITGAGRIQNGDVTVLESFNFNVADALTNACLTMTGRLTFREGAKVSVLDPENLEKCQSRVVAIRAEGGIVGKPVLSGLDGGWRVTVRSHELRLSRYQGLTLIVY